MKRLLLAAALSLLTAGSAMAQTVILVRHAEKADQSADTVLSDAGEARAAALATALADAPLTNIFVSPLKRTALTATPAAMAHSLSPEVIALDGGAQGNAARVAERVHALPADAVVLIVGHSNTIPVIARALGYSASTDMPECEFDRLTILELAGDHATAVVGRYGTPTTC